MSILVIVLIALGLCQNADIPMEVTAGNEFFVDLPKKEGYVWKICDEAYVVDGLISYVVDYVDRSRPEFQRFVFQAGKLGFTSVSFTPVHIGEIETPIFYFPQKFVIHVVEKPDTGMISPSLPGTGIIHPVHKPIQVTVGEEVVIDIIENPSTGYTWKMYDESYKADGFLSYIRESTFKLATIDTTPQAALVGSSSIHRFVFRGEKSGMAKVLFVEARFGLVDLKAQPETYFVHVVEKPDTGIIGPAPTLGDSELIRPVHKPLQVEVGSEVMIDMIENPSTGYTWKILEESYKTDGFLSFITESKVKIATEGEEVPMVGQPLIHRFILRGEKCGQSKVLFVKARFGEIDASAVPEAYFIHVVEKPDTGMISPSIPDTGMIHPVHKPLEVVIGGEVVIDIIENPTTGYTWTLYDETYKVGGFLSYVGESKFQAAAIDEAPLIGAPSIHRFVFRGEKSGLAKALFVQARFGQVDNETEPETYFVHVVEKPDTGMIGPLLGDSELIKPVHKPLQVEVGSEVSIDMVENPSTGYTWKIFEESYATGGLLSFVNDTMIEMTTDEGEKPKMGAPSVHRFVFRGERSGECKVLFIEARFGEIDASSEPETYFVHVVEKPDTGMITIPDEEIIKPVNKPIQVVVGEEAVIDIIENPTTGYTWTLLDDSYKVGGYLTYVRESTLKVANIEENIKGAPSIHRFVFRGEKSGYTEVLFVQARFGKAIETSEPEKYFVHVVEKPNTGLISPLLAGSDLIHPVHKPLQVIVGEDVSIDMIENPTTGYSWKILDKSYATDGLLSYVSDSMLEMTQEEEPMFGAPSVHRFVFRGEKSGYSKVVFVQVRFGEIESSSEPESYYIHVVEKPDTGMISPSISNSDLINPVHKPIQVTVSEEVVIDIVENPTTGYTWEIFDETYSTGGILSYVSDFRVEMNTGNRIANVGEPSIHRFVFRGEKPGTTLVYFVQARFGKVDVNAELETYFVHVVENSTKE